MPKRAKNFAKKAQIFGQKTQFFAKKPLFFFDFWAVFERFFAKKPPFFTEKAALFSSTASVQLAAQAQTDDERVVALEVVFLQVVEELSALCSHRDEAAARVEVLLVGCEVVCKVRDSRREKRNLHFAGACVFFVKAVFLDDAFLVYYFVCHFLYLSAIHSFRSGFLTRPHFQLRAGNAAKMPKNFRQKLRILARKRTCLNLALLYKDDYNLIFGAKMQAFFAAFIKKLPFAFYWLLNFYMKIFCGAFCLFLLCGAGVAAENLQDMFDAAAQAPEKILRLQAKTYVIEKPIVLDNRHSGLTVLGDPAGRTVITSEAEIKNWRGAGGGIFEADVPEAEDAGSLFVNSRRAQLAETPNGGFFFIKRKVTSFGRGGSAGEFIADKGDILPLLNCSEGELKNARVDAYMSWMHVWLKPEKLMREGMDEESVLVKFLPPASCRPFFIYDKNPRYKILNIRSALDLGGEFCFDKSARKIFYKPREFEDMKAARAVYPRLETLLLGAGKSAAEKMRDVKFKNVIFECGGVKALENGAWVSSAQGAASFPALVSFKNASGIVFEDCAFYRAGGYAVEFALSVWNSKIENCVMGDLGAGGVRVGSPKKAAPAENPEQDGLTCGGIKVLNNVIFGYGRECRSGIGILVFDAGSCEILNNEIFDGYYTGISAGWTWGAAPTHTQNNRINYNKISHLSFGVMSDLGGIYTLGPSEGSEIIGNVISDITCHNYGGWGIYNDEGSSGFLVRKNFVKNAQEGGYFMHYGSDCAVENNLFAGSRDFQVGLGRHNKNSFIFRKNMLFFPPNSPVLRGGAIAPENAKFERNAYWGGGAKLDFAGMDFEAWQKSGQDAGSVVEFFDFEKIADGILQGGTAEKIGFEKLDIARAGAQGKMRVIADKILKNYKFPEVLRTPKKSDFEQYVFDDFSREKLNEKPVLNVEFIGEKGRVVKDEKFGKVLEVADEKCEPAWMPYFYYRCNFKSSQRVKISFKMKLERESRFLFELRENEGVLGRGAKFEIRNLAFVPANSMLPENEWLCVEMFAKVNSGKPCGIESLRICRGEEELVKAGIPARENFSQTFGWVGFIFTGDGGAKTRFSDFKIEKRAEGEN